MIEEKEYWIFKCKVKLSNHNLKKINQSKSCLKKQKIPKVKVSQSIVYTSENIPIYFRTIGTKRIKDKRRKVKERKPRSRCTAKGECTVHILRIPSEEKGARASLRRKPNKLKRNFAYDILLAEPTRLLTSYSLPPTCLSHSSSVNTSPCKICTPYSSRPLPLPGCRMHRKALTPFHERICNRETFVLSLLTNFWHVCGINHVKNRCSAVFGILVDLFSCG